MFYIYSIFTNYLNKKILIIFGKIHINIITIFIEYSVYYLFLRNSNKKLKFKIVVKLL